MSDPTAIRDAATVVVLRKTDAGPKVLMGQRGAKAAFMPNKFVFPGGAVDDGDKSVPLAAELPKICSDRLMSGALPGLAAGLAAAAIRELWEETGLILGTQAQWATPPTDWHSFAAKGFAPDASGLTFIFRAITPPGRPRRFDARFFLVDADKISTDPDDFTHASDELRHLQWIALTEARRFDLPFITEVVLAEVKATLGRRGPPDSVPFFNNSDEQSLFERLGGDSLLG